MQWGVEARLIQAEESRPLTEAMLTLARNAGGESAGEMQGEQGRRRANKGALPQAPRGVV